MISPLIKANSLDQNENGVWTVAPDKKFEISEKGSLYDQIEKILTQSSDLSSTSIDIERRYPEWDFALDLRLSPRRANLLRGLNLSGIERVLELGCGCGVLTRYLGEQGVGVEAVEVSEPEAAFARLRNAGMKNVEIIHADYQELTIPKNTYDAVFLIGLLDDIKNYKPVSENAEQGIIHLLGEAMASLREEGILVLAAENRTGLKYWFGASEKHHKSPYLGLYGCPTRDGLQTFDREAWVRIIERSGLQHHRFFYPFPDHFFPKTVLSEEFVQTDPYAHSLLHRIESKDYLRSWDSAAYEYFIWKDLHRSEKMGEYANSFLIACGASEDRLKRFTENDFVFFSDSPRRHAYRTLTKKPAGSNTIVKQPLLSQPDTSMTDSGLSQRLSEKPYCRGRLLSEVWQEAIVIHSKKGPFQDLLKTYREFIFNFFQHSKSSEKALDFLPFNIIVEDNGNYQIIDDEWVVETPLSPQFILFRALMWFGKSSEKLLKRFAEIEQIDNLKGFIAYGFNVLSLEGFLAFDQFIEQEEKLQANVNFQKGLNNVRRMIDDPWAFWRADPAYPSCRMQLYWADHRNGFSENRSVFVWANTGKSRQIFIFPFDVFGCQLNRLKLKPIDRPGFFRLHQIVLKHIDFKSGVSEIWMNLNKSEQIANSAILENILLTQSGPETIFSATSRDPYLFLDIPEENPVENREGFFHLEVEIDWPESADNFIANTALTRLDAVYRQKSQKIEAKLKKKEAFVRSQSKEIAQSQVQIYHHKALMRHTVEKNQQLADAIERLHRDQRWRRYQALNLWPVRVKRAFYKLGQGFHAFQNYKTYQCILNSKLFDVSYYLNQNPDVDLLNEDPVWHYIKVGVKKGKNPSALFDTAYYLNENPDVPDSGANPLAHFLTSGEQEGRKPHPLFDISYYLTLARGSIENGVNSLEHFLVTGAESGLNPHPLFDTRYYLSRNPDVQAAGKNPLIHYLEHDPKPGLNPHPLFDTSYYLSNNLEDIPPGENPLIHYVEKGGPEGRNPGPLFDAKYYLKQNPELLESPKTPLEHYLTSGAWEAKNPNPIFETAYYLRQNPEVLNTGENPLVHYLEIGAQEGRNPGPLFDTMFYLSNNPDVKRANLNPLAHFLVDGAYEGRNPNPVFNSDYYLKENPDLIERNINALGHFIEVGEEQGKKPCDFFDPTYYTNQNPDVKKSGMNPLAHYLQEGVKNQKKPNPLLERFKFNPLISIICYLKDISESKIEALLGAIQFQIYRNWELLLITDHRLDPVFKHFDGIDPRIKKPVPCGSQSVFDAFQSGVHIANGEFLLFLKGNSPRIEALFDYVRLLNENPKADLIHCDQGDPGSKGFRIEDISRIDSAQRVAYFVARYPLLKKTVVERIETTGKEYDGPEDPDFLMKYISNANPENIMRISKKLFESNEE